MAELKLVALDEEDLRVVSAHVQDAVAKVGDIEFDAPRAKFILVMNRFVWEKKSSWLRRDDERRRSVLHFERVLGVKLTGIDRARPDEVLSLLAITFDPGDAPAGHIDLIFAGDAAIRLEVECIEARLADGKAAWAAVARPRHRT